MMLFKPTLPTTALVLATTALVLSACQTASDGLRQLKATLKSADLAMIETRSDGPALAPAPLPVYGVGDAFAYDNNRIYTVTAVKGDRIDWDAGPDYRYATRRNFTLPKLSWSWTHKDGTVTSGTATPDTPPDTLWPLKVGNRAGYGSEDTYIDAEGKESPFHQDWKCWVAGTEKVSVPAGDFDTFEIVCDRRYDNYWAQRTHWFYAPAVGHYVRRVFEFPRSSSRTINLVAYGPRPKALPPAAARLRASTVQRALERLTSNHTLTAEAGGYKVAVTPLRTLRLPSGTYCRDYRQQITARGRTSLQKGHACRNDKGLWRSR